MDKTLNGINLRSMAQHHEFWLGMMLLVLVAGLSAFTDGFLTAGNFYDILISYAMLGIMACGLFVVLVSGGMDISFTAIASVAQYVMAAWIIENDGNFFIAFVMAGVIGIALGSINALLIHHLKVPAIIITIATLNLFYGLLIYITDGNWLYAFPDWFMDGVELFAIDTGDTFIVLSLPLIILFAAIALTGFIMNRTSVGRQIYAMGGNAEAASRIGFSLIKLHVFVYGYMGVMAAIAAVVQAQIMLSVAPNALVGLELTVVAAVVLGGTSLMGGVGTLTGTIMGVLLLAVMRNGLTLIGVSSYWHEVLTGLVIIMSVGMTALSAWMKQGKKVAMS